MSLKPITTCSKCKKDLPRRGFLTCSECQHKYHLECANVSQTRYYIMEKKDQWMCTRCITKPKKISATPKPRAISKPKPILISTPPPSTSFEPSTAKHTGPQLQKCKSINDLYEESHSTLADMTSISLPEDGLSDSDSEAEVYKNEMQDLKLQLTIANTEIDKLNLEIVELKKCIVNRDSKIKILKSIGTIDNSIDISSTKSTPIRRSKKATPSRSSKKRTARNEVEIVEPFLKPILDKETNINKVTVGDTYPTVDIAHSQDSGIAEVKQANNLTAEEVKQKVVIIGDEEGKGLNKALRILLGVKFDVQSILMPGASLVHILGSSLKQCLTLTKSDYVILVGGSNDKNPLNLQSNLYCLIEKLNNTNVIVSEVFKNNCLNAAVLNSMYKFISNQFCWSAFAGYNMIDERNPVRYRLLNLSRSILREVLRLDNKRKYLEYYCSRPITFKNIINNKVSQSKSQSTQTDESEFFRAPL